MSAGYINITVVGNLGKDPEIRSTSNGKKVASFSLAVDQGFGGSKRTEWVNCIAWEKLADLAEKHMKKGMPVALSGTLQTSSWEDRQSGQKKYKTEVVARDITFMDGGKSESRSAPAARRETPAAAPRQTQQAVSDPFNTEISDDNIPF